MAARLQPSSQPVLPADVKAPSDNSEDPALHAKLLDRFGDVTSFGMTEHLDDAAKRGEVRSDVSAADLVEAIAGMTLIAIITRNQSLNDAWVERTATLIMKGISA